MSGKINDRSGHTADVEGIDSGGADSFHQGGRQFRSRQAAIAPDRHGLLAAFDGEKSGPKDWGINPDAHLTAVVVHNGKVVKSFAFESVNETDVRAVLAELKKAAEKK